MSYWMMVRASYGTLDEWGRAVVMARKAGWSFARIHRVLLLWSPISFLMAFIVILMLVASLTAS